MSLWVACHLSRQLEAVVPCMPPGANARRSAACGPYDGIERRRMARSLLEIAASKADCHLHTQIRRGQVRRCHPHRRICACAGEISRFGRQIRCSERHRCRCAFRPCPHEREICLRNGRCRSVARRRAPCAGLRRSCRRHRSRWGCRVRSEGHGRRGARRPSSLKAPAAPPPSPRSRPSRAAPSMR